MHEFVFVLYFNGASNITFNGYQTENGNNTCPQ